MNQLIGTTGRDAALKEFPRSALNHDVGQRFEEIVNRYPRQIAVQTPGASCTYEELNRRANRIAHALRQRGGNQGEPIAVLIESSPSLFAAILGVLKAGRLVAPLDPSYPSERLATIVADSGAGIILTNDELEPVAREMARLRPPVLNVESLSSQLSDDNPERSVSSDTLAFLLYSSGSTGKPKGIVHPHCNVLHNARLYTAVLSTKPSDRAIMVHAAGFIAGVNDTFNALLNGTTLFPWDVKSNGLVELGAWMVSQKITLLNWVPTIFRHLMEALEPEVVLPSLRAVMLGGEPVTRLDWELFCRHCPPDCLFINRIGSTESNNYAFHTLDRNSHISGKVIPVGHVVEDKQVLILDDRETPAVSSAIGQIAVRSRYISPGYWRRPDLTAAVFRPDPENGDRRIYLTGDFGRVLPNGCLEFHGRRDSQLKFHGVRIEATEIELALKAHPGVLDAAAMVLNDNSGHQCLVAGLVARESATPKADELHRWLSAKLPPAMVPSRYIHLPVLPMTDSGKLDRHSLAASIAVTSEPTDSIPLVSPTQKTVAAIWAEVLRVDRVGRTAHFFNLGGHSLTAVRMLTRLRNAFHVDVPLRLLFEAPTVEQFAARIDTLVNSGAGLPGSHTLDPIPPRHVGQRLELCATQRQLLFLQRLEPDNPAYNVVTLIKFRGALDPGALQRALTEVVRRHEILRSIIREQDGNAVHAIQAAVECDLNPVGFSRLSAAEAEDSALKFVASQAAIPFDLAVGPLLRTRLIHLAADTHWLFINVHHIIFDGASMGVLMDELGALYSAFAAGKASVLPELRWQFADLALWRRRRFSGEFLSQELAYWTKQLEGASELLDLPVDHARGAARGHAGGNVEFTFPRQVLEQMRTLGQEEESTVFMVVLAAFQLFLSRYSRQEDVCVGSPIAARNRVEAERLIGYFANVVVLRGSLAGNPTFRDLLRRTRSTVLDAFAHQDTPLEHIVTALNPTRSAGQTPLFQAALIFNPEPLANTRFAGLTAAAEPVHNGAAKFDVTLTGRERPDGLHCALEYRSALFEPESGSRMCVHFDQLLRQVVECPDARIGSFDLMSAAEQHRLTIGWNNTRLNYDRSTCVHQLFEQAAKRRPGAPAVVAGTERISYGQLNARANRLAHRLRRGGVSADVRVGVFMERSLEMIVALLAVLKAGGAYVPLDPSYPRDRLTFIAADAKLAALITQPSLLARAPSQNAPVILGEAAGADESEANPDSAARPSNLAYVMYTSGSTGRPKGVAIEHRSVVALAAWAGTVFTPEDFAGMLFSTSICFDLSVFELFITFARGGRIILAENALELPRLAAAEEVTLVNTVPSAMTELVRNNQIPRSVRTVNLCGEPLPAALVDAIHARTSAENVYDLYGPTEDTVYSTFALRRPGGIATIGRPIANSQAYILDPRQRPVPIGVPGEMYLAGEGLARGYLNRPDLTAERFVANPFSSNPDDRMYRTGDLCRYLADGNIEFLGRIDHQLKIRGFRIELGEIESVLREVRAVRDCIVAARETKSGDKTLVAYVVQAKDGQSVDAEMLRDFLRQKLPDYMLPAAFVFLERLPLTPNGKIDRRALPAPDAMCVAACPKVAPRTHEEKLVARVWAEVLNLKTVGINDNFFDLGGHSLLAARLVSGLENSFGRRVPIASLFHAPTIAALAKTLTDGGSATQPSSLVNLQPRGAEPPLFCMHGWGGDVYCFLDLAQRFAPDRPVYGLQAVGADGRHARHGSVEAMATHYAREIQRVRPEGPYHLIGYSLGGWIAYAVAQELQRQGQRVAFLGLFDTRASSDVPWRIYVRGVVPYLAQRVGLHFRRWIKCPPGGRLHLSRHLARSLWRHFRPHILWRQLTLPRSGSFPPALAVNAGPSSRANSTVDYYYAVASRYRPPPYHGNVDLFIGEDTKVFMHAFWRHLVRGRVRLHRGAGDHSSLLSKDLEDHVPELKRVLGGVPRPVEDSLSKAE